MNKNSLQADLIRVAKRENNERRRYVLVNTLQGKHVPVLPSASYEMMTALGRVVLPEMRGKNVLVVGFAETATAIAAVVAGTLGCRFITTTRESIPGSSRYYRFLEEHSHATDQSICGDRLDELVNGVDALLLVDDEISTGKTVCNMITELCANIPELAKVQFYALSVVNRMNEEELACFGQRGIYARWLVRMEKDGYDAYISSVSAVALRSCNSIAEHGRSIAVQPVSGSIDPRLGVTDISQYARACARLAGRLADMLCLKLSRAQRVLILGTEECMYPAMITGLAFEKHFPALAVRGHATTRSPITPSESFPHYPIRNGWSLRSFYDSARQTFIYNLDRYDFAVVLTDAYQEPSAGAEDLALALREHGVCETYIFRWIE